MSDEVYCIPEGKSVKYRANYDFNEPKKRKKAIGNLRYWIALKILKYMTPVLYNKIDLITSVYPGIRLKGFSINKFPRPLIKKLKSIYGNTKIKGVEIGVWKGHNAISILNELNIEKLYLIDTWDYYKDIDNAKYGDLHKIYLEVCNQFKNYKNVEIIKGFSNSVAYLIKDNSLDFAYIDGNHTYKYVLQDINIWNNKVKVNGVIGGHDIFSCNDVLYAVRDYCIQHKQKFYIDLPDWYFIKY